MAWLWVTAQKLGGSCRQWVMVSRGRERRRRRQRVGTDLQEHSRGRIAHHGPGSACKRRPELGFGAKLEK